MLFHCSACMSDGLEAGQVLCTCCCAGHVLWHETAWALFPAPASRSRVQSETCVQHTAAVHALYLLHCTSKKCKSNDSGFVCDGRGQMRCGLVDPQLGTSGHNRRCQIEGQFRQIPCLHALPLGTEFKADRNIKQVVLIASQMAETMCVGRS